MQQFDATPILNYLELGISYSPSPSTDPIDFLTRHLRQLPPHLLTQFSQITTAKERSKISTIRNRRLNYYNETRPDELQGRKAQKRWPELWGSKNRKPPGRDEGEEEKVWARRGFLAGGRGKGHVGKLGELLGGYEEEREAERIRRIRRERGAAATVPEEEDDSDEEGFVPEEDSDSDDDTESFERVVKERFIYGLLEDFSYDMDWDDSWDRDEEDLEEAWFEED